MLVGLLAHHDAPVNWAAARAWPGRHRGLEGLQVLPLGAELAAQGDQCCASLGVGDREPFFSVQSSDPTPESPGSVDGASRFLGPTMHLVL